MNNSKNTIQTKTALKGAIIIVILLGAMLFGNVSSIAPTISFEGKTWTKEIRGQGASVSTDYYPSEQNKVVWDNSNGELTALESTGTYRRSVGVSYKLFSTSGQIDIEVDWKVTSGHSSPRRVNLAVFDMSWQQQGGSQTSTNTAYTQVTHSVTVVPQQYYYIFFYFSDSWAANWNTKLYIKNFELPSPTISFEGYDWTKQIRGQGSAISTDYYPSEQNKVVWDNSNGELTAQESTGTYRRSVGVSYLFFSENDQIDIEVDWKVTSGHSSPRRVNLAVFDMSWQQQGGSQTSTNTAYTQVTHSVTVVPQQYYYVFFYFSDSWAANWNTKLYIQNFQIVSPEPTLLLQYDFGHDAAVDISSNSNNGILFGGITSESVPAPTSKDYYGESFYFDGYNDYVSANNPSYIKNLNEGTVSAWVKTTDTNAVVFSAGSSTSNYYYFMFFIYGSQMAFYVYGNGNSCLTAGGSSVSNGQWQLLTWTSDGSRWQMFQNGVLVKTVTPGSSCNAAGTWFNDYSTNNFAVGVLDRPSNYGYANAYIDELQVYDMAVSTTQAIDLYNGLPLGTTKPIKFSGYDWTVSSGNYVDVRNEIVDYRNSVHFDKLSTQSAQMSTRLTQIVDQPFEVKTSYREQAINSEDWAPSMMISFDNGFRAAMTSGTSLLTWSYNGATDPVSGSGIINTPFAQNTWYDWRIQVLNHLDMQRYNLVFSYKGGAYDDWVEVKSMIVSSNLGIPTLTLGTTPSFDKAGTGLQEDYWFADVSVTAVDDQDGDGLTDLYEFSNSQLLASDSMIKYDTDGDGLSDGQELSRGSENTNYTIMSIDPNNPELSQTSWFLDSWYGFRSNPRSYDTDLDGLSDGEEMELGSNPNKLDTDGDGVFDKDDSEPTVVDTFAPSYLNINDKPMEFSDGVTLIPKEKNLGEGVYLYVTEFNGNIYIAMELYDDRGIDNVRIWSTSFLGLGDFDSTIQGYGVQTLTVTFKITVSNFLWWTHEVHIQVEDFDGYKTDKYSLEISSSFSELIEPVTSFLQTGANWVRDKVGDVIGWATNLATEALNAYVTWMKFQVEIVLKYVQLSLNSLMAGITSTIATSTDLMLNAFRSYQPGISSLEIIFNDVFVNLPLFDGFKPVIDFLINYEDEINWIKLALELVLSAGDPLAMALFGIKMFSPYLGIDVSEVLPFLDIGSLSNAAGQLVGNTLNTVLSTLGADLNSQTNIDFDISPDILDAIIFDLATILDPEIADFIIGIYSSFVNLQSASLRFNALSLNTRNIVFIFAIGLGLAGMGSNMWDAQTNPNEEDAVDDTLGAILAAMGVELNIFTYFTTYDPFMEYSLAIFEAFLGFSALIIEYKQIRKKKDLDRWNILSLLAGLIELTLTGVSASMIE